MPPFIFEIFNTPKWIEFIGDRSIKTIKQAKEYIKKKMRTQLKNMGFFNNTFIRKTDAVKIGTCGLCYRDGIDGVDIGFAFLPEFEKQGYAFESAKKIMEIGMQDFGLKKINATTIEKNRSSIKLIEKLRLNYIKKTNIPNDTEELLLYTFEF